MALIIAQQQMEQLRNVPFTSSELNATTNDTSTVVNAGFPYTVSLTVIDSNVVDNKPTLKTITLQVTPQRASSSWANSPITLTTQRSALSIGLNVE
jgi:PKD repeat protein